MIRKVKRPWGYYKTYYQTDTAWFKEIVINPGEQLSLQKHFNRGEKWYTNDSAVQYNINGVVNLMHPCTFYYVEPGTIHRLGNVSRHFPVTVLEWAIGEPDEADIIRLEDNYGRL